MGSFERHSAAFWVQSPATIRHHFGCMQAMYSSAQAGPEKQHKHEKDGALVHKTP